MEVVIERDAFLKGLQMVQNIVEPRQTLPILANVLLEAAGDSVRLTATDLEVGARVSVPAKVGASVRPSVSSTTTRPPAGVIDRTYRGLPSDAGRVRFSPLRWPTV